MTVKKLRSVTGMPIVMCSSAWKDSGENWDRAIEILKEKGMAKGTSLDAREAEAVFVGTYVHHDGKRAGVVRLCCETDFVANTLEFRKLANDIAMHVCVCEDTAKIEEQLFVVGEKETIDAMMKVLSGKTGEKITIGFSIKI
jgi:elongation factor Ts